MKLLYAFLITVLAMGAWVCSSFGALFQQTGATAACANGPAQAPAPAETTNANAAAQALTTVRTSKAATKRPTNVETTPLAILTAFSRNHLLENVAMLKTLIHVGFQGPIYIYLMRQANEESFRGWADEFRSVLQQSALGEQAVVIEYEVQIPYSTYCWKPMVVNDFLTRNDRLMAYGGNDDNLALPAQVMMWSDSSTRYIMDPTIFANRVLADKVDFAGRMGKMHVAENTHIQMFDYFGYAPQDFKDFRAIVATHFLINLEKANQDNNGQHDSIRERVLAPWIDCGTRACQTCMAPIGSLKHEPNLSAKEAKKGSLRYLGHRQDQSALALLLYDFQGTIGHNNKDNNMTAMADRRSDPPPAKDPKLALAGKHYMVVGCERNHRGVTNVKHLLGNLTLQDYSDMQDGEVE